MTLNEYQKLAARTINGKLSREQQREHALFGLPAEVGEITGLYQKQLQGHPIDPDAVKKEIGDVMWMVAELCTSLGMEMDEVGEANIDKLRKRYPEGFSEERSLHRTE